LSSSPDELLKSVQQAMASKAASQQPPAPVMGNAQGPLTHVPLPIAVKSSISALEVEPPVPPPEFSEKLTQVADDAVAADATQIFPVGGTSEASVSSAESTKIKSTDSIAQAMRKLAVVDGMSEFVKSKKHGKVYVVYRKKGFPEVLAIASADLNARIRAIARKKGHSLKQSHLDQINEELRSEADESGTEADLYTRVAPLGDGGVEIDLCDGVGTTVQITKRGVLVMLGTSATLFIRSPSARALPLPSEYGGYDALAKYVNLRPVAFLHYVGWLTFTIASPKIEATKYVFLVIKGTQGTGKTWTSKLTKRVIDPNAVIAQMLPGSPRDLAIMLQTVHLLVVDNLRDLGTLMSDTLCVAATGGSVPMRKLYTDDDLTALHLHGAIMFNGIHPFMGQSDFADRCMVMELEPIDESELKSEAKMLAEFEADLPVILGGLYDLIARILGCLPAAKVVAPSRMLDFCQWLAAMELALGMDIGSLQLPYAESLRNAQLESLQDNPLAVAIMAFAEGEEGVEWVGTPTDFYNCLTKMADFSLQRSRAWPSSAAVLSKRLHGLQAPLLAQGISIDWTRGKDRQIVVRTNSREKS
jgi:hypothetical protein